jgi:transposase-like protein
MRLQLILPRVEPEAIKGLCACPYEDCDGTVLQFLQAVEKPLRDSKYSQVVAHRYQCLRCLRTHRVYPKGVSKDHISQRVKGLGILLYLLGLSYGAVSLALEALGVYMCKSRVYDAVQRVAEGVPGMKRDQVFAGVRTPALGGDVTSVKVKGQWFPLGLTVDETTGLVLTVDGLSGEDAATLEEWMAPIVARVGAEILVTDDADAFKVVADNLGRAHQVCKSHVKRNTESLIQELHAAVATDADGSLAAIGVTPTQAYTDLKRLEELIVRRKPEDAAELESMHDRYLTACSPRAGEKASTAYRLRLLFLDRWNLWPRLTKYRTWQGANGESLDGTNNGCERAIGWWIKERYRTMRGYKRAQSAVNVSRLLAWCGNHLNRGGADLSLLLA